MLKDIDKPKVEGVGVAIVYEEDDDGNLNWTSYLINEKDVALEGVLVRTSGYGKLNKKEVKTSDLRYFLDVVAARSYRKLEIIPEDLLPLNNQYWVSYYLEGRLHDKKYVFVPDSIHQRHLVELPLIGQKGILIS